MRFLHARSIVLFNRTLNIISRHTFHCPAIHHQLLDDHSSAVIQSKPLITGKSQRSQCDQEQTKRCLTLNFSDQALYNSQNQKHHLQDEENPVMTDGIFEMCENCFSSVRLCSSAQRPGRWKSWTWHLWEEVRSFF